MVNRSGHILPLALLLVTASCSNPIKPLSEEQVLAVLAVIPDIPTPPATDGNQDSLGWQMTDQWCRWAAYYLGSYQQNIEEKPDDRGNKPFTIQVAALRDKETADQLCEKLKKGNYRPYIEEATLPGNVIWYRLRCGRFVDHNEAASVLEGLRKEGFSPILVRR